MQKSTEPIKTITYTVEASDTLSAVAARFDTTPSELAILNRLTSRTVFPGQIIRVPEKTKKWKKARQSSVNQASSGNEDGEGTVEGEESGEVESDANESNVSSTHRQLTANYCESNKECDLLESLRPASPKPGHVERVRAPLGASYANRPRQVTPQERFLKIHVRHITDGQGVVAGVLLVTPNAVMFDPNVSDTLVIEHGAEAYGVIAPMEFVVNVAIYHDIAHMRVAHIQQKHDSNVKQEIYHLKHCDSVFSEGGANLYRSTREKKEQEEERDEEQRPKEKMEEERNNNDIHSQGTESSKPDGDSTEVPCSCGPGVDESDPLLISNPPNTVTCQSSTSEDPGSILDAEQMIHKLEERRQSSLDHHWPVPKSYLLEQQQALSQEHHDDSSSPDQTESRSSVGAPSPLVKTDCHDSGIDMRDPVHFPAALPTHPVPKAVCSDADILLRDSSECIPPMPIIPFPSEGKKAASVSFDVEARENTPAPAATETSQAQCDKHDAKKKNMLKRLSNPLGFSWMDGFSSDKEDKELSLPSSGDSSQPASSSHSSSVFSKVFSRRPSVSTFIRSQHSSHSPQRSVSTSGGCGVPQQPKLNYHSMVSVDDMPELFVAFDKLIPRPARSCEDPPLYLRLRMGKPKNQPISRSTPIMSYGKKKMRPEYWFSVPRNRVDELYKFLTLWVPHLYGDLDEEKVAARGFELIDSDTELWDDAESTSPEERRGKGEEGDSLTAVGELGRESWEHPLMCEELRRALYANSSLDFDLCVPDLNGVTEILTEDHRKDLCRHLPARAEGYTWTLVFSTSQHGFSLSSLYRKMNRIESPILLVIQDTDCNVFGALTSCSLKTSDHFYGTGESLLFSFTPELQVYNWTGDNMYFIKGNNESLSIGAGDGKFGLWLDGDLYQGRSEPCSTYGNEPLSPQQDFVVKTLECWAFI